MKNFKEAMLWLLGVSIILVVLTALAIGGKFGDLFLKPFELSLERKAYKSSHQYVEAKQTEILNLVEKIEGVQSDIDKYQAASSPEKDYSSVIQSLENQRDALKARIKRDASQIPSKNVPSSALRHIK